MPLTEEQVRLIFGLKLKQIRTEKGLSLFGLSKKTGLSKSYLNEIEKGKKYPKPDKIVALASSLETPYDEMVSMKLTGTMAPVSNIVMSGILKEIPLELFGISQNNLIDIIANAPEKVTAFIGTLFEIARKNDVTREKFYLEALRAYQESHENYFPELEKEVQFFMKKYHVEAGEKLNSAELEEILVEEFNYKIDYESLDSENYPEEIRSIFIPKEKKLLIANNVSETQRVFILAKELGYCHLGISERPLTFTWIKFESFEDVLNNFKASYFAGALIIPEGKLVTGLQTFFNNNTWSARDFHLLMQQFTDSAETFFQRLTNILPKHFGLRQLYFLRFSFVPESNELHLSKELHLTESSQPKSTHNSEHYCRRWTSTDILINRKKYTESHGVRVGVQRSTYKNSDDDYLILTASNEDPFKDKSTRSVCIGIKMTTRQKKKIAFADDENIPQKIVGVTCERCPIIDCKERVLKPIILNQELRNQEIESRIYDLINRA